jgi:hypothetical protein
MRIISDKHPAFGVTASLCFIVIFLVVASRAWADDIINLRGKPFSDPSVISEMPQEWLMQPIKYEDWAEGADMAVSLDQHFYQFFEPMIAEYAKKHHLNIKVREGTCGISSGLLYRKAVDIAAFCCPPGETDRLPQLRYHTLGITGLTVLVHPDNPVDDISLDQARKIFQGKITNWSELKTSRGDAGPDMRIQAFARLHCKLRPGHWCSLLAHEDLFSSRLYELGSIPDVIEQAATNPKAISGFESPYMAYYRYAQEIQPKLLTIDGTSPVNIEDVISGRYPMYFIFNVTTWDGKGVENPEAQKLVDYLLTQVERIDTKYSIAPASRLREAGWKFSGNELLGEPK